MADRLNSAVLRTYRESEPVIYIPAATGVPLAVVMFFDRTSFEMDANTMVSRFAYRPRVFFRLEDLGREPAENDRIEVLGDSYSVTAEERDGYGGVVLYLQRLT